MKAIPIFLFFIVSVGIAHAGDEQVLNQQLRDQKTVYLEAKTYVLDGPVKINSGNCLIGQPGTVLKVSDTSSQWFTGSTGVIYSDEPVNDVLITDISLDGNCENLPASYANTPNHQHDCENLIRLQGFSNQFSNNISIYNVRVYNAFSDGIHVAFANNVQIFDVEVSNCQHVGISLTSVKDSIVHDCKVAGITNACLRYDNDVNFVFFNNLLFSYTGSDNNNAWEGGEWGVVIGDAGVSHGFDARNKPTTTQNGEGYNNTIVDVKLNAFELDSLVYEEWRNVYLHDNHVYGSNDIETNGISVNLNLSTEPTIEQCENAFSILQQEFIFQYPAIQHDFKASATVTYENNSIQPQATAEVNGEDLKVIKFQYAGKVAKHFIEKDIWTGELSHVGNQLYIPGYFQPGELQITVYGDAGFQKVEDIQVNEIKLASASINPDLFIFLAVLAVVGISITRNLRRIL